MRKSRKIKVTDVTNSLASMKDETYLLFSPGEVSLNSCRAITYRLSKTNGKKYVTRVHDQGLIVICMPDRLRDVKVGLARRANR